MERTGGVRTRLAAEDVVEKGHHLRERENTEPKVRYEPFCWRPGRHPRDVREVEDWEFIPRHAADRTVREEGGPPEGQ